MKKSLILLLTLLISSIAHAKDEYCVLPGKGGMKVIKPKSELSRKEKRIAQCISAKQLNQLKRPDEIEVDGAETSRNINTRIGVINARWPREIKKHFGRSPDRAIIDAARATARALSNYSFKSRLDWESLPWKVIFIDEDLNPRDVPPKLLTNCHPAWMTPPANVYVVAQRVTKGCGYKRNRGKKVADKELAEVLIHEFGHVVEHLLLKRGVPHESFRAEGFATWFEAFASGRSSVIKKGELEQKHFALAKEAIRRNPNGGQFSGSGLDYARASLYFHAITEKKGTKGLLKVYDTMNEHRIGFFQAVEIALGYSKKDLEEIAGDILFD